MRYAHMLMWSGIIITCQLTRYMPCHAMPRNIFSFSQHSQCHVMYLDSSAVHVHFMYSDFSFDFYAVRLSSHGQVTKRMLWLCICLTRDVRVKHDMTCLVSTCIYTSMPDRCHQISWNYS